MRAMQGGPAHGLGKEPSASGRKSKASFLVVDRKLLATWRGRASACVYAGSASLAWLATMARTGTLQGEIQGSLLDVGVQGQRRHNHWSVACVTAFVFIVLSVPVLRGGLHRRRKAINSCHCCGHCSVCLLCQSLTVALLLTTRL